MHAILSITDHIQRAIEEGKFSCGIFLDLKKAFDSVNHQILINKLDPYGIRGTVKDWFVSYLHNRKQFVNLGTTSSDLQQVSCGVPQGSTVLGSILFLLSINDFQNSSVVFSFHLFADDADLFHANRSLTALEQIANDELTNIQNWLHTNKLALNIKKSSFLIFHPVQKKLPFQVIISCNGEVFKQDHCIKYLGIMFDSHLNWKDHVKLVANKIKRGIVIISKIRLFVNEIILINLYYTLIYPFYSGYLW